MAEQDRGDSEGRKKVHFGLKQTGPPKKTSDEKAGEGGKEVNIVRLSQKQERRADKRNDETQRYWRTGRRSRM